MSFSAMIDHLMYKNLLNYHYAIQMQNKQLYHELQLKLKTQK